MKEEETWLSEIFDALFELESISMYLIRLGDSFDMTGNQRIGSTLVDTSNNITNNINKIRESLCKDLNQQFKNSQASSTNLVKALLERHIKKQVD